MTNGDWLEKMAEDYINMIHDLDGALGIDNPAQIEARIHRDSYAKKNFKHGARALAKELKAWIKHDSTGDEGLDRLVLKKLTELVGEE